MCGIYGFLAKENESAQQSERILERMGSRLSHRGPDATHNWTDSRVSIGMSRLSIIDLEAGQQPFWSVDSKIGVVFNGEIYNHKKLRKKLESDGVKFRSDHADGEVIVHLYDRYGLDFIHKIEGMFGIAIYDKRSDKVHLIRDFAGIKPVFYYLKNASFAFGSEIKALFEIPWVSKEPNYSGLSTYFSNKNVSRPETAYASIFEVPQGGIVSFDLQKKNILEHLYWEPKVEVDYEKSRQSWVEEIREQFLTSVVSHTESDVEYGAYLSGGVDSSAVVGALVSQTSQKLKTFTLVYEDGDSGKQTDRSYARKISEKFGTEHYEQNLNSKDVVDSVDDIVDSFDEPFSGVFSTFFLSSLISKYVKVALSGDGADELFGSYFFHRVASILRDGKVDENLGVKSLLSLGLNKSQAESLIRANGFNESRFQWGVFNDQELARFLKGDLKDSYENKIQDARSRDKAYDQLFQEEPLNSSLLYDFQNLLPNQVLTFVDRLSMAHSLEVRPPFLDRDFIELAFRVPGKYKIEKGRVKSILKDALEPYLVPEILDRPKEGFVLPMNQWFETDLKEWKDSILHLERLDKIGLFDSQKLLDSLELHKNNSNEYGKRALNIIMFILWWEKSFS